MGRIGFEVISCGHRVNGSRRSNPGQSPQEWRRPPRREERAAAAACLPSFTSERGPISRILSGRDIYLRGPPKGSDGQSSSAFLFGLAPTRVCRADPVARTAGGLLHHPFTLACAALGHRRSSLCCTFPRLPLLRFPQWPALRSPDFPPDVRRQRRRPASLWPSLVHSFHRGSRKGSIHDPLLARLRQSAIDRLSELRLRAPLRRERRVTSCRGSGSSARMSRLPNCPARVLPCLH
jgi:hypothetical protein